ESRAGHRGRRHRSRIADPGQRRRARAGPPRRGAVPLSCLATRRPHRDAALAHAHDSDFDDADADHDPARAGARGRDPRPEADRGREDGGLAPRRWARCFRRSKRELGRRPGPGSSRHHTRGARTTRRPLRPAPCRGEGGAPVHGGLTKMSLATFDDLTPTTAHAIEARHIALDPRIRQKQAKLEDEREARHAVVGALGLKLRALREELVAKRRRLADAIANAAPEWSHGESAPGGGAGAIVTTGGFPDRAVREQEVARLAENLQHAEAAYQAAQARWASIARVVENCREWIQATPIAAIVPVVVPYERVPDPRREVETIRAKIITLGEEAAQVEGGPVSLADALARLDEQRRKVVERV